MKHIGLIIPVYNEQAYLPPFLAALSSHFKNTKEISHILFVNDGSTDKTARILRAYARKHTNVIILENSINGNLLYQEIFSKTTNNIGLVNLVLGEGNPISGDFPNITWKTTNYLEVELDINNSGNYTVLGINKLQAVPYSLFSKDALHAIYADTASFVKTMPGDKTVKLDFGPTGGISTNNAS